MKAKILPVVLGLSLLLNVAGIVFFICFLKMQGNYRHIRNERNVMAQNLTAVRASGIAHDIPDEHGVIKRTFQSLADGQEDFYALMPPRDSGHAKKTLIVYLHGMGSNYLEPFVSPMDLPVAVAIASKYPNTCVLSCSYRKEASWGNDLAFSDITQNVRSIMQEYPFEQIVLMGTSMGGCTSLSYATAAPPDIKSKITGIVSVEGAGDLKRLCETTDAAAVKYAIAAALGGDAAQAAATYQRKSFLPNLTNVPPNVRIAVVSATRDRVVPTVLQQELVDALQQAHRPVKMISVDTEHGVPPAANYVEGLDFAISGS